MNTFLKRLMVFLSLVTLGLLLYCVFVENIFASRLSPKDTITYKLNDLKLEVFYNRPSKKGRDIFGGLIPLNEVWRTGANEATTFETNKPLDVNGNPLPAGKYTLWSVPKDTIWKVIFNSKQYPWGVTKEMKPYWDPNYDVLEVEVPIHKLDKIVEQFTIGFDNTTGDLSLTMAWDDVKVAVPIEEVPEKEE